MRHLLRRVAMISGVRVLASTMSSCDHPIVPHSFKALKGLSIQNPVLSVPEDRAQDTLVSFKSAHSDQQYNPHHPNKVTRPSNLGQRPRRDNLFNEGVNKKERRPDRYRGARIGLRFKECVRCSRWSDRPARAESSVATAGGRVPGVDISQRSRQVSHSH